MSRAEPWHCSRSRATSPLPLEAYAGTYTDSLYGDATVSMQNGHLDFRRGTDHGRLEYWNTNNFRWYSNSSIPALMPYVRFDVLPDGKANGVYYGLAPNILLLERKKQDGGRSGG